MDTYSQVAGTMVFVLVAAMFIMFLILDSPKYESKVAPAENFRQAIIESQIPGIKFELDSGILVRLNVAFYSIVMLFILSLMTLIFLIRAN